MPAVASPASNRLLLILPLELKQWLIEEAERQGRSMNQEARRMLEECRARREQTREVTQHATTNGHTD